MPSAEEIGKILKNPKSYIISGAIALTIWLGPKVYDYFDKEKFAKDFGLYSHIEGQTLEDKFDKLNLDSLLRDVEKLKENDIRDSILINSLIKRIQNLHPDGLQDSFIMAFMKKQNDSLYNLVNNHKVDTLLTR